MSTPTVDLRPSRAARTYAVGFTLVWCALVLSIVVRAGLRGSPTALVAVLMLAVGATLGWRLSRLRVYAAGDRLTVRNTWRTRELRRADVEEVRTGQTRSTGSGILGGPSILLLLRDGSVLPLEGARNGLPYTRRQVQGAHVEQLQAWLRAG